MGEQETCRAHSSFALVKWFQFPAQLKDSECDGIALLLICQLSSANEFTRAHRANYTFRCLFYRFPAISAKMLEFHNFHNTIFPSNFFFRVHLFLYFWFVCLLEKEFFSHRLLVWFFVIVSPSTKKKKFYKFQSWVTSVRSVAKRKFTQRFLCVTFCYLHGVATASSFWLCRVFLPLSFFHGCRDEIHRNPFSKLCQTYTQTDRERVGGRVCVCVVFSSKPAPWAAWIEENTLKSGIISPQQKE